MATNPRQPVLPGQRQRIAAAQVNWLNQQMGPRPGFGGPAVDPVEPGRNIILAQNQTGGDLPQWGVMAITGIAINPNAGARHEASFAELPCVVGTAPTIGAESWCVAVEPIKSGSIGRVAVGGVVQCKISVTDTSDSFVKCTTSTSQLKTSVEGEGLILWKSSSWALIRLGGPVGIRRGTFTAPWNKGTTKVVDDAVVSGRSCTAKNYFANITASGTKKCAIASVGGEWILIAAEC